MKNWYFAILDFELKLKQIFHFLNLVGRKLEVQIYLEKNSPFGRHHRLNA